eukprot:CAMPEP_0183356722 /NCGR_PEP_ID=MMETSP0164_2-20130417/45151_1 /TAXON_ID=221442 /ORGANISM="Coccolithus pelagicus ssp braarudi, Strain PLY182g" /LENGTH=211 /DNA_ID=CAMNT_0025530199 /DNA_START=161 /DNA_END=794 /DNA_ORIENTATION=+
MTATSSCLVKAITTRPRAPPPLPPASTQTSYPGRPRPPPPSPPLQRCLRAFCQPRVAAVLPPCPSAIQPGRMGAGPPTVNKQDAVGPGLNLCQLQCTRCGPSPHATERVVPRAVAGALEGERSCSGRGLGLDEAAEVCALGLQSVVEQLALRLEALGVHGAGDEEEVGLAAWPITSSAGEVVSCSQLSAVMLSPSRSVTNTGAGGLRAAAR